MKIRGFIRGLCAAALLAAAGALLAIGIVPDAPVPAGARDYFVRHGVEETGAINLVSAIYLGYRAFDTLGETIVLLLAISGLVFMLERETSNNSEN